MSVEKVEKKENKGGSFVSFILLKKNELDLKLFVKNFKEDWDININEEGIDIKKGNIVATIDDMMLAVSLMPAPIPDDEAVENAKTNFRWDDAVKVATEHKAHIMCAVLKHEKTLVEAAVLCVKACSTLLKQPNATGINTLGSVLQPEFYIDMAEAYIEDDIFPIQNLIFFGIYSNDNGKTYCGYTYGMDIFCHQNMEVIDSHQNPENIHNMLSSIASYVIENDVTLKDGETIGLSAEQKLAITSSKGEVLDEETLKIAFE